MLYVRAGVTAVLMMAASVASATMLVQAGEGTQIGHGGGCRKSSPPGQCCHMDNSAGSVHCH